MMSANPPTIEPQGVPPGVPANLITPQGNMPAIGVPNTQDYPRLVFTSPYFETVAIAEIIQPSVTEAVENALPSLIPPYVDQAVLAGVQQYSVLLTGSTMSGPLFLSPLMPTQPSQAATMAYVDAMLATAGIPEVPPVPQGQIWARETGQWVPISQSEGTFLPITGGTMQGNINMSGNTLTNMAAVPAMPNGAAPAQWVLNQIASVSLYQGTWDADTNTPDLTQLSVRVNGYTWIAITTSVSGVVIGAAIPGLQGLTIYNGDTIIYSTAQGTFSSIHAGGLTLPEADARYVQLAGSQMSGALLLNSDATQPMAAVPYQQLEAAVANTVTPDAPADGQAYLRVGVGANRWVPGLPLAGGILTGALTLAGNATSALNPVPLQQMTSAITASIAGLLPIAGGTMTGPIVLAGNATTNLNPVPLQQLNAMVGSYLPLTGGTLSGPLSITNNNITLSGTGALFAASIGNAGSPIGQVVTNTANVTGALAADALNVQTNANVTGSLLAGSVTTPQVLIGGTSTFYLIDLGNIRVVNWAGGWYDGWNTTNGLRTWVTPAENPAMSLDSLGNLTLTGGIASSGGISISPPNGLFASFVGNPGLPVNSIITNTLQVVGGGNSTVIGAMSISSSITPTVDDAAWCGLPGNAWFGVASYSFAQQSDPRLKTDLGAPAPGALARVQAIPVHRFTYKSDAAAHEHTGFDATEVEVQHPDAVYVGEDENKTLSLSQSDMLALLWQAVQELAQATIQ